MSIVKNKDKRTGITYVYESESYWDKEKQQPRSHRKLIGKLDETTGEIIPTDGRGRKRNQHKTGQEQNTTLSNYSAQKADEKVKELQDEITSLKNEIKELKKEKNLIKNQLIKMLDTIS